MSAKLAGSLTRVASIVAIATLLSKLMGAVRQLLIADAFGSGPDYSAFGVAYILPSFLFVLLGGINGPFHSAMVSVLKKREGQDWAPLVETISTVVGFLFAVATVILMLTAKPLVYFLAPGASQQVHVLAAQQLQILAPLAFLAGQIGIGFGTLTAAEEYWLPSISPLLSSLATIVALLAFGHTGNSTILAWGFLAGGIAQWLAQIPLQAQLGLAKFRWRWQWHLPEVRAVVALMVPAAISSGMIHINVYTDIFFASFIPGDRTIGNLGYAQFLYITPLGILSNAILVPLMNEYSRLAVPDRWPELRQRIRQGLVVTGLTILPPALLLGVLAYPIVRVVYERGRFTPEVTLEVAALLSAYAIGMLFYLGRDVMVRIFYALEDSRTPLRISVVAIALNALFDWIGIQWVGAPGLALATAGVNAIATVWLGIALQRHLGNWPWQRVCWDVGRLLGITAIASLATWQVWWWEHSFLKTHDLVLTLLELSVASLVGLSIFALGAALLRLPEVELMWERGRNLLLRRG
jgi:putative peptidoglycan lipid II flippase